MKKKRFLSVFLCLCLMIQCLPLSVGAAQSQDETQAAGASETYPQETEPAAFGTVCVLNGCRTIEGMNPLAGSERKLDTAQSAFLYEVNTDTVVYSYNPDAKVHPGTLAKIVLAVIVLQNCKMEDQVTVTEGIQSYLPGGATRINLKSNEHISVGDLLYALLLYNANDAAVALAHHVAGSTDSFLTLMNNWVKQIGCPNTEFGNISGLYTAVSYSTARDMAKIMREAMKNEDFVTITGTRVYTIPATDLVEERSFKTLNYMLDDSTIQDFYDERVTGGFQSYHEDTGASIVCTSESKGMSFIGVILGATRTMMENGWQPKIYGNFNEMTDLLKLGFNNYKVNRIIYNGMSLGQFTVAGGESNVVGEAQVDIDSVVPIEAHMTNLIMTFSVENGGLAAPIQKGQRIATMQIKYRDSVLAEAEVFAMSQVKSSAETGVTVHSAAGGAGGSGSGILSTIGTVCVILLGLVGAYLAFNSYMRTRVRARRRKRRADRRRSR